MERAENRPGMRKASGRWWKLSLKNMLARFKNKKCLKVGTFTVASPEIHCPNCYWHHSIRQRFSQHQRFLYIYKILLYNSVVPNACKTLFRQITQAMFTMIIMKIHGRKFPQWMWLKRKLTSTPSKYIPALSHSSTVTVCTDNKPLCSSCLRRILKVIKQFLKGFFS